MGLLPAFVDLANVTIVDTVLIMTAATGLFVPARNWQGWA